MTREPKGLAPTGLPREPKSAAPSGLSHEPKGAAPSGLRSDEGATREDGASRAPGGGREDRAPGGERDNRASGTIEHWPGELVSLGDHQVYVRSVPDDGGEPAREEAALCVHGLAGSSRNWTDLMDLLRPALAADALDLPGFGDSSPRPDGRYSIAALAQTVAALIERRGRGPVHLIANSLGGAVSVKLAAARPELVKTLTLISPALPDSRPRLDLVRFPVICLPRVGTRLLSKYQALPPATRVADVIATCYSDPALFSPARFAVEVTELARRDTLDYATAALVGSIRTLTAEFFRVRHRAWRDAARITAPCLVIYASDDRLVDPRLAGRAAHAFQDARIVVLPRTGHLAHMERPVQVAAEIGVLLGNSRPLPPVDRGAERDARAPAR